ncbi:MAG: hypothetical protein A2275_14910 [Bacteroidetes bacterium RIFOXYA12_FULL_35_11]|nr:MAG: hypothetical protein A2X01_10055 [Bacteroidetes bacterium GWF2_35_48]OFY73298.1 MAG: hypothetical protein A2275_14910 [Bacteroidetes bacterium RIFOXYA12_FULL_35_11]OFY97987.1 MAG: hypothetical protein A2491_19080 [Bacteroidetes bacterium RIFOXYC12_FULL_35_7]HBX52365.1 hypothetical protein [Bacteroidales bacterium]
MHNKDAYIRYKIINQLLVDKKYPDIEKIKDAIFNVTCKNVATRTIAKDIQDMRYNSELNFHAPIEYDSSEKGYYYSDSNYSIDELPISEEELEALHFNADFLKNLSVIPVFENSRGTIERLITILKTKQGLSDNQRKNIIDFQKVPRFKGIEHIEFLIDAIKNKKVINITHQSFYNPKPNKYILHPLFLKEDRFRWYLIAYSESHSELRTFGLDRIKDIKTEHLATFFQVPFHPELYFQDTIGVFVADGKVEDILLKFAYEEGQYLKSLPLHESQKIIEETKDFLIIKFKLAPTYELINLILGWGPNVEVIQPQSLRDTIKKKLETAVKKYKR